VFPAARIIDAAGALVSADWLASKRKYALIVVFVVAAFLTPPDVISQVLLAIPILALYELSIVLIRLSNVKKPRAPEAPQTPQTPQTPADGAGNHG
jgi:sec-independent protein translocase protein TatC